MLEITGARVHYTNMGYSPSASVFKPGRLLLIFCVILGPSLRTEAMDGAAIIGQMEGAYAKVDDYQARVEVKTFESNGSVKVERFLYTFKKPRSIRLDMETPHPGMVLIFPDEKGKVYVRFGGKFPLPALHLSLSSRLLRVSSGQRLDQTDLGQLIANIAHSLTDQEQGPVSIIEEGQGLFIRVLAADHFRPHITTLYEFKIDEALWLPVAIEESTPAGSPERSVVFKGLRINTGITRAFFHAARG